MKTRLVGSALIIASCIAVAAFAANGGSGVSAKVTFSRDVAPILYNRCAECHRPGEVAPMSLLTYSDARPWAKSVKQKVLDRSMPPWLAAGENSHFKNDRRLPQKEIDTITAWVDGGAVKGSDADLPAPPKFEEGWAIGKPDAVLALEETVPVPAEGVIPYKYLTVQTNFNE